MEIVGYQSRVRINQVLPFKSNDLPFDSEEKFYQLINTSWLYNPFGDNSTYGVKFMISEGFSWYFFMYAKRKEKAKEIGNALLMSLQERFKGLDGKVEVCPLYSKSLEKKSRLIEIKFPNSPSIKLHFFGKIINYYKIPQKKMDLNVLILWKRDDLHIFTSQYSFMIRIFISLKAKQENLNNINNQILEMKTILSYLISDITKSPNSKVGCYFLDSIMWDFMLRCNVFPDIHKFRLNPMVSIPKNQLPLFLEPDRADFYIPQDIPLPKPPI